MNWFTLSFKNKKLDFVDQLVLFNTYDYFLLIIHWAFLKAQLAVSETECSFKKEIQWALKSFPQQLELITSNHFIGGAILLSSVINETGVLYKTCESTTWDKTLCFDVLRSRYWSLSDRWQLQFFSLNRHFCYISLKLGILIYPHPFTAGVGWTTVVLTKWNWGQRMPTRIWHSDLLGRKLKPNFRQAWDNNIYHLLPSLHHCPHWLLHQQVPNHQWISVIIDQSIISLIVLIPSLSPVEHRSSFWSVPLLWRYYPLLTFWRDNTGLFSSGTDWLT